GDKVRIAFADGSGGYIIREITSALSITVPSGATLGFVASLQWRAVIGFLDNAGTVEMVVGGRPSGISDNSVISTTILNTSSDSPRVLYSATARTNVRFRIFCYLDYTLTTPATWNTAPSLITVTRSGVMETSVRELLYQKTLTANGTFDTNEWWPG